MGLPHRAKKRYGSKLCPVEQSYQRRRSRPFFPVSPRGCVGVAAADLLLLTPGHGARAYTQALAVQLAHLTDDVRHLDAVDDPIVISPPSSPGGTTAGANEAHRF
jgi:hypothetical protein